MALADHCWPARWELQRLAHDPSQDVNAVQAVVDCQGQEGALVSCRPNADTGDISHVAGSPDTAWLTLVVFKIVFKVGVCSLGTGARGLLRSTSRSISSDACVGQGGVGRRCEFFERIDDR